MGNSTQTTCNDLSFLTGGTTWVALQASSFISADGRLNALPHPLRVIRQRPSLLHFHCSKPPKRHPVQHLILNSCLLTPGMLTVALCMRSNTIYLFGIRSPTLPAGSQPAKLGKEEKATLSRAMDSYRQVCIQSPYAGFVNSFDIIG